MNLNDDINSESAQVQDDQIRLLRRQRDSLSNTNARLIAELASTRQALSLVETVEGLQIVPPSWTSPAKPRSSAATLVVMLSDTHFDEVVDPDEMEGLNAYNQEERLGTK